MKYVVNYREVTREEYAQSMAEIRNRNKIVTEYYGENNKESFHLRQYDNGTEVITSMPSVELTNKTIKKVIIK